MASAMLCSTMSMAVCVVFGAWGASAQTGPESEFAGPEPASAVLFFFAALAFGIVFRRAFMGFVIPYTGVLLVRNALCWHELITEPVDQLHTSTL